MEQKIENGVITETRLGEDHGCLTFYLVIEGDGWGCGFGGYVLAHWGPSGKPTRGAGAIAETLKTVGVDRWEDLPGTNVRVETEGWGGKITAIGHIYKNQWFSLKDYFEEG